MLHSLHMKLRWNWKRWPFALAALALGAAPALAHEKWFVDHVPGAPSASVFTYVTPLFAIAVAGVAAALFVLASWIDRRYDGSAAARWLDAKLAAMPFNPRTVLGVSVGVSLMGAGLQGTLFAPSLVLGGDPWSVGLGLAQVALGSLFLFLEPAYPELGFLLAALYLAGLPVLPLGGMLEELFMLGAAVYFLTGPSERGSWKTLHSPEAPRLGYQAFRILTGLCFLVLSSVKWLHPELALQVVGEYRINFLSFLGATDAQFVYVSAVVETLVALCLLLRVAFRPAVAVAFFFFLTSIFFLGFRELLGHLPVKAALFLFFLRGHWHAGEGKA